MLFMLIWGICTQGKLVWITHSVWEDRAIEAPERIAFAGAELGHVGESQLPLQW